MKDYSAGTAEVEWAREGGEPLLPDESLEVGLAELVLPILDVGLWTLDFRSGTGSCPHPPQG
jgi:hypothetical protein